MTRRSNLTLLVLLAGAAAGCSDRPEPVPTAPPDGAAPTANAAVPAAPAARAARERLARRMALALADPGFRAYVKAELDASPVREHKLQLQRFIGRADHRVLDALAAAEREPAAAVQADARSAIPLELYLPVPAHRAAWVGGEDVLVATAEKDHDVPVAFDIRGRQRLLSPDRPPATPVLAVVPVETDFETRDLGLATRDDDGGSGGGGGGTAGSNAPTGLYMTYSHFRDDFEGWLKGNPEYEIHILGQLGSSDSLTSYQCAGEHAGGYYAFDQNDRDWSGSVLLFSTAQLSNYRTAHPDQNVRVLAIEDDDGACQIKLDGDRFKTFQTALQTEYPNLTGGKDTTTNALVKIFRRANALQKILRAAYSWITTQDDLIGNAIEDDVVGEFHAGANWIVRGESNVTNGWLNLQMR